MKYPKIFNSLILENRRKLKELTSKHAEKLQIAYKEKLNKETKHVIAVIFGIRKVIYKVMNNFNWIAERV